MQKVAKRNAAVTAAYQSIHHFFDLYHLPNALQYLEGLIEAASHNKIWKQVIPANLLFFTKQMDTLCNAAHTIHYAKAHNSAAIITPSKKDDMPQLQQHQQYVRPGVTSTPWHCVPRHLDSQQYHNPYKVIKKIATAMPVGRWSLTLHDLLLCAFSNESISETWPVYKLLQVRKMLLVMVEAFHLIEIRCLSNKNKAKAS